MNITKRDATFKISNSQKHLSDFQKDWWENVFPRWEEGTYDRIIPCLDKNKYFVDIGAWIGPITLVAQHFSRGCISIEPDPKAFKALEETIKLNNFNNIHLENKAVSLDDSLNLGGAFGNSTTSYLEKGQSIICQTISLADIFHKYSLSEENVSVIKIDVEGYEKELLHDEFLQKLNVNLHISFHSRIFKRFGQEESFYSSLPNWLGHDIINKIKKGNNIDVFIPKSH